MELRHLARVLRSKNAGPGTLTLDIMLPNEAAMARVLAAPWLTPGHIARLYGVAEASVRIVPFAPAHAVKIVLPREAAGAPGDRDVYGAQAHAPLLDLPV